MDETLGRAAIDLSGRPHASINHGIRTRLVGDLQAELITDFFEGFAIGAARQRPHQGALTGADRATTAWRPCSAFARALAWPAAGTASWRGVLAQHKGAAVTQRGRAAGLRAGNLTSVRKALVAVRSGTCSSRHRPVSLRDAGAVVVPGVGHFAATAALGEPLARRRGVRRSSRGTRCSASAWGCSGCSEGSAESPDLAGLGLLSGRCVRLDEIGATEGLKIPARGLE